MASTREAVHYTAIAVTVFLGLILLFAFSSLSGRYYPSINNINQSTVSIGQQAGQQQAAQPALKRTSALGTNVTSKVAIRAQLNITSYGYGQTQMMASNALETNIGSLDSLLGNGYAGPYYSINVTSYNITKTSSSFIAYSNISITILKPSNVTHVVSFIDSIPNTVVATLEPKLTQSNLTSLRLQAIKGGVVNASSQIAFYLGVMPVYSENVIVNGLPAPVSRVVAANTSNATALEAALGAPVWLKGIAMVNATYSSSPIQYVSIGNSITVNEQGYTARLVPKGIIFIRVNASGTTPQLAASALGSSLSRLNATISQFINRNLSLVSTSNYKIKFALTSTGPSFYALESLAVTIPNAANMSSAIAAISNAKNSFVTGIGTGYTSPQASIVQNEITNIIANSTQIAGYLSLQGRQVYLTGVTILPYLIGPLQPEVYLNSTTRPSGISTKSVIYNQSVFLNSTVSATFEYSSPISSSVRLTTTGIASGIPAEANVTILVEGNGTTGQIATNSLIGTLRQLNSTISPFINRNFSLVTIPNYTVTSNSGIYTAYVNVRVLLPNIANMSAVQQVLGILPNATVTGITPTLSQSQLTSLESQALASAIAQARSQISVALGSSGIPQISVSSQSFNVTQIPSTVSTSVSSQPVALPTIGNGINSTQSVVATINVTATVSPAAIR